MDGGGDEPGAEWLGTAAAADYLGITVETLRRLIKSGRIPASRVDRALKVHRDDVTAYIESSRIEPGALSHLNPQAPGTINDSQ